LPGRDFAEIAELQHARDWQVPASVDRCRTQAEAAAEGLLICTNTMHRLAESPRRYPYSHPHRRRHRRRGSQAGVNRPARWRRSTVRISRPAHREVVTESSSGWRTCPSPIDELCQASPEASKAYIDEIGHAATKNRSVIMGCTEITMLIGQQDFDIPVFDTDAHPCRGGGRVRVGLTFRKSRISIWRTSLPSLECRRF
jgi:aspartate racemase